MEKKFNVGDRVRFIRDYDNECVYVDKGDCGTIEKIDANNGILITLDNPEYVRIFDTDYIEQIMSTDSKTAFLSDLADVLRRHKAVINVGWNGNHSDGYPCIDVNIQFENSNRAACLEDVLNWSITADNIMDYDKE